jgi:DNA-binding transcriptional LysR family regulator
MSRPLNFREIEAFRAVMLTGTTVGAARMLHTTQPSISRLISQAQMATGLALFANERGRLHPTQEALHLFDTIQLHFQGLEKIENTVSALRESGTGVLRIACTPTLALGVLPQVVETFMKSWPNVHLNVQTMGTRQMREGMLHGLHDIAMTNNGLEGSEFHNQEIHTTEAVCVMAPGHPLADRRAIDARDLQHYPLLCLDRGDSLDMELRQRLAQRKVTVPMNIETTYSATICVFAAQGIGLGIVNPYIASVFRDRVAVRRFTPRIKVTTYASNARFAPASELTGKFLKALVDHIRATQWD